MALDRLWYDPAKLCVGGAWRDADGGDTLPLEDPSTGAEIGRIARGTPADIDAAVSAAAAARAGAWGRATAAERGRVLARIGRLVAARVDDLAAIEAADVGKPLAQARADALALARYMEFYGGAADKMMGETIPYLDGYTVYTLREPHGVTGHIVPWNYPMQIIGRSVGAALAMGNACVLKPAEEACLTALAFAHLAGEAGLPAGALNVVPGLGEEAGAALAAHPGVNHISFTGSVAVGAAVQAAAAANVVPVTLELGGKSPQVVFADADLDAALPFLVNAGIQNAGQTCSASSRILVERGLHDALLDRMAARYRALRVGPAAADLDVGPLISARQKAVWSPTSPRGATSRRRRGARSWATRPRAGITWRPRCWPAPPRATGWRRTRSSARCRWSSPSRTRTRRWPSPTAPITGSSPRSGPRTARGRCAWRAGCARDRSSSTITAPAAGWNCPSAAPAGRATGARRGSRRSTGSRC